MLEIKNKFTFDNVLIAFLLFSFLLFPPVSFSFLPFKVDVVDLLLPFILFSVIRNKAYKNSYSLLLCLLVAVIILLSILFNGNNYLNNYFEIYHVIKIFIIFLFIKQQYSEEVAAPVFNVVFILLCIFNLLHYFNIGGFNESIMPLYCGTENRNLIYFGCYTNGMPGPKRMIGTMGNPNHNALIFQFFCMLYMPKTVWKTSNKIFFFTALVGMMLCQSRTSFVTFPFIFILHYFFEKIEPKKIILQVVSVCVIMLLIINLELILSFFGLGYADFMNYAKQGFIDNPSLHNRYETWMILLEKVLHRPLLGYSPDKRFFIETQLCPDNEYISVLYQYGIIGLIVFLAAISIPLFFAFKTKMNNDYAKNVVLITSLFAITSMTNQPFSNPRDVMLYIIVIGSFFHYYPVRVPPHINSSHVNHQ